MPDDPKLTAYLAKARSVAPDPPTPAEIAAMKARHEGCKEQFREVALKLRAAVATNDRNAIQQHEDLLRENFRLRKDLVERLKVAGVTISDPDV